MEIEKLTVKEILELLDSKKVTRYIELISQFKDSMNDNLLYSFNEFFKKLKVIRNC